MSPDPQSPEQQSEVPDDPLVASVRRAIHDLLIIKNRLPMLREVFSELSRRRQAGAELRNDSVLQVVRDSGDMLVVDLASLREGVTRDGFFKELHNHLARLRRFTADDSNLPGSRITSNDASTESFLAELDRRSRESITAERNKVFDRLFPAGAPVSSLHVGELIRRFRAETEPTDQDRNRVRAHRYENAARAGAEFFQTTEAIGGQIEIFERYFNDIFLVLTKTTYIMKPPVLADAGATARDLADMITIGSIDQAVLKYGLVSKEPADSPRFYWELRQEFFAKGGTLA